MRPTRTARTAAILTAAATVWAIGGTQASSVAVTDPVAHPDRSVLAAKLLDETVDQRDTTGRLVEPTAAQRSAVSALAQAAGAGTTVTWDRRFGTLRTLYAPAGSARRAARPTPSLRRPPPGSWRSRASRRARR